jgi:hypothetical protein
MADISQLVSPSGEMPDAMGNSDATPGLAKLQSKSSKPKEPSDEELITEANGKYSRWRADRRPYEAAWFYNAALIRGLFNVKFNPVLNILESRKAPSHRTRDPINIILPKVKAKLSKFLKSRPAAGCPARLHRLRRHPQRQSHYEDSRISLGETSPRREIRRSSVLVDADREVLLVVPVG